jgi:ferritin-like metal-binding protein YciE
MIDTSKFADGIIKETDETGGEIEDKAVLDAAILANAQTVEHYEMSRYGTLIAWAEERASHQP